MSVGMLGALLGLVTLGLTLVAGRALAFLAGERRPFVGAGVGLAVLVLSIYGWARATQSMVAATALTALTAAALIALAWRRAPPTPAPPLPSGRLGFWGWTGVLTILVVGAFAVFGAYFWDEYSCHFPLASSLARGVVPAVHPLFPYEQFRYHYAFDLLAGAVRALTGLNVAQALDVVSIGLLALLLGVARDLGASLGGDRGARLMPVILLLGTGTLATLLNTDMGSLELHWDVLPVRWRDSVPPPTISNFFQHPQAMGMVLALTALMLFDRRLDDPLRTRRSALAALVMGALSLSQIVFFGTLGLVLGLATLAQARRAERKRQVLIDGALLASSLVIAYGLGGFLAPGSPVESTLLFGRSMFRDQGLSLLAYHLVVFGLPLIALPVAVALIVRRPDPLRVPIAIAAVFGFLVPHFVTYARSWDIVKFLGVGAFFANALFADLLARWPNRWRAPVIATLVALATVSSWVIFVRMGPLDGRLGVPKMHFPGPSGVGRVVGERMDELMAEGDQVFSVSPELGSGGGIPTPGFDWHQVGQSFLLDQPRSEHLARVKDQRPARPRPRVPRRAGRRVAGPVARRRGRAEPGRASSLARPQALRARGHDGGLRAAALHLSHFTRMIFLAL
ncbi:MAG: hypothetical protein H6730_27855 [Deltaproteobacteria bacterium]|nr:hypothetical protein [Deltaproteobacteria bacterium]